MTQPVIQNTIQTIEIDGIGGMTVTSPVSDGNGNYIREIRVIGVIDSNYASAPVIFTLRVTSPSQSNVAITTPTLSF